MTPLAAILTDRFLRRQAGTQTYQSGLSYCQTGHVIELAPKHDSFTAIVSGHYDYEVFIGVGRAGLDFDCECPIGRQGDFCKHCVAACLAWLHNPPSPHSPAKPNITPVEAAQCPNARAAFDTAANPRDAVGVKEAAVYAQDVTAAIDIFQKLLNDGHAAAVIDLCEHAIRTVDRDAAVVDDRGETLALIDRLAKLHRDACVQLPPDPIQLAQRLFQLELDNQTFAFQNTPETYQDILGPAGLSAFKKLAEQPHLPDDLHLRDIRASIARVTGDVDMLLAALSRELSYHYHFHRIAEICLNAGRYDEVLSWAEKGLLLHPTDFALRQYAAGEYHRRNEHETAMKLVWPSFTEFSDLHSYQNLRQHAELVGEWPKWRDNALGFIRRRIARQKRRGPADNSKLVEIFLHEGNTDDAWREAQLGGCTPRQWMELAEKREKDHPSDAASVYLRLAEAEIIQTRNGDYNNPVAFLIRTAKRMKALGASADFERQLATLRTKYKAKKNFIKLLNQLS